MSEPENTDQKPNTEDEHAAQTGEQPASFPPKEEEKSVPKQEPSSIKQEEPGDSENKSDPKETTSTETDAKEMTSKESEPKETQSKETASTEVASKDMTPSEPAPKKSASKEVALKETSSKEGELKQTAPFETATPKEVPSKEMVSKETAPTETAPQQTAPGEIVPKETIPGETAPKDIEQKEIAPEVSQVEGLEAKLEAGGESKRPSLKTEKTAKDDGTRRRSSIKKKASLDHGSEQVDLSTFLPPDASPDKRGSTARRISLSPDSKTASVSRKSRFGMLGSKARMVLGSIVDIKANVVEGFERRGPRYQNTYKLDSENPFNPEKVDKILREVMHQIIENLQYDPDKCASTAKYASMQIRSKVKQLEFDRYKLVCVVSIGEKNSQDVYATCRFLWDAEKDRYSFYALENSYVYAIAYCFGLYYE